MNKVRWGLLSTANINKMLIPAIRASERGELTAVASRSQESADTYAAEWGIPLTFGSYETMLASESIDAVYISVPNHLHVEWSIRAMELGKHVLCEKPFALNLEEMERAMAVATRTGMVLTEAFMYRHHPQTKIAGEFLRGGRLGDISLVRGVFSFRLEDKTNVRMIPELGGGSVWDIGCYPISIAQYFMGGPPVWVFADQDLGETGAEEIIAGQMHYSRGRIAQFTSSFRSPYYTHVDVLGTKGRLIIDSPFRIDRGHPQLRFYPREGDPVQLQVPEKMLYLGEIEDMHDAILDGAKPYLGLDETRDHIRTILAVIKSAELHQPVRL
ncbi:MAG: Gfo/Idh/MocA family oxidoreductase [Candidatus Promineifilaceae bacterium]|nr:Gfo/Idh/MocA family oxidoreductase [Candidatus Promineifilaceae bacterium]